MADTLKTNLNLSPCTIGELTLDLLLQEDEKLSNKVTQYPVENGSPASDHVVIDPVTLTITGFVTNAPVHAHSGTIDGQARVILADHNQLNGTDINFAELALTYLRRIRLAREAVSVSTKRGTWDNMLVQDVSRSKTKDTGDALVFTITLIEFRQVELFFVQAPKKKTKSARAQARANLGKKTPVEDSRSTAHRLAHGVVDYFTKASQ